MKDAIVMFLSDGTGVTSETFGQAINTQIEGLENVNHDTIPFVRTSKDCDEVIYKIEQYKKKYKQIVIYSTIADKKILCCLKNSINVPFFDLYEELLVKISMVTDRKIVSKTGQLHGEKKDLRSKAIDFALNHDDGKKNNFDDADIILLGLSRTGKTPTCMWMALHYGIFAANYPITDDDFLNKGLPKEITKNLDKCVLLTTNAERLSEIRQERYKNSNYASLDNCKKEINSLKYLEGLSAIPHIDVTNKSVEEISASALHETNIHPRGRF